MYLKLKLSLAILDMMEILKTQFNKVKFLLNQNRFRRKKKIEPKSSFPEFDGNQTKFLGWLRDIDNQLRFYLEDETKITKITKDQSF